MAPMENLKRCACGGFLPSSQAVVACPHCGRPRATGGRARALARGLACIAAGGAVSVTLMACYGPAPAPDGRNITNPPPNPSTQPSAAPASTNNP